MLRFFVYTGFLLMCSGCSRRALPELKDITNKNIPDNGIPQVYSYSFSLDDLWPLDIPLPDCSQAPQVIRSADGRKYILCYKTDLILTDLAAFYRMQMEHLGWQERGVVNGGAEICLSFKKGSKMSIVIARVSKKEFDTTRVTIFISSKTKRRL
jgi:hypothetical protein